MKKTIGYLIVVLVVMLMVVGCTSQEDLESEETPDLTEENPDIQRLEDNIAGLEEELATKEETIEELQGEIDSFEVYLKSLEGENDYYYRSIDDYLEGLSEDELLEILKAAWNYSLTLYSGTMENHETEGMSIPADGHVTLDEDTFILTLAEEQPAPILEGYQSIYNQWRIDEYTTHLQILDYEDYNWEGYAAAGTVVDSQSYEFIDVPQGQVIHLEVTDVLQEELGLNTDTITITIQ